MPDGSKQGPRRWSRRDPGQADLLTEINDVLEELLEDFDTRGSGKYAIRPMTLRSPTCTVESDIEGDWGSARCASRRRSP